MKRKISIKHRLILVIVLILTPLTLVFSMFTTKAISHINLQLAEANRNTLRSFCTAMKGEISLVESSMNLLWGENEAFEIISGANRGNNEQMEWASKELTREFEEQLERHGTMSYLGVYSTKTGVVCETYTNRNLYSEKEKSEIRVLSKSLASAKGVRLGWFIEVAGDEAYFVRMVGKGEATAICFVALKDIGRRSQTDFALVSPVVFAKNGKPLTSALWLNKTWKEEIPQIKEFRFAGAGKQYMIVKEDLMGLTVLYGVPYRSNMGILGWLRIGPWLFFGVIMIVLMLVKRYLKYSVFRPLKNLVQTMERIASNELECRSEEYASKEFAQVNDTFNTMITTITDLKIENYEQRLSNQEAEMAAQKAELVALRLQIHPHFYLNCLKNIYGMAQCGEFEHIQQLILMLSAHLRYTFTISSDLVPLGKELQLCENYIQLQGIGQKNPPKCQLCIDPSVLEFQVPPISVLTLVENCVKHGTVQHKALIVHIDAKGKKIDGGILVDIVIQDNGGGFSKTVLDELNDESISQLDEIHVGISNTIKRLKILYGKDFAFSCWNADGAAIELMVFQSDREGEKG